MTVRGLRALPEAHRAYLGQVTDVVRQELDTLGCYLHGSASLGGFDPDRSDLDVLVIVGLRPSDEVARRVGERLLGLPCPATALELSIVTAEQAQSGGSDTDYVVHVDSAGPRVVLGNGSSDADLILHYAVCRDAAIGLGESPPAEQLVAEVPRRLVLDQLAAEIDWALREHPPPEYVVLNACRALRFVETGELVSKVDGGVWVLRQAPDIDTTVVRSALGRQTGAKPDAALEPGRIEQLARSVLRRIQGA